VLSQLSANREVDHDRDEHIDRSTRKTSRLESPLGNSRHSFFIEAAAIQGADDTDLRCASVACDDDFQHNRALNHLSERTHGSRQPSAHLWDFAKPRGNFPPGPWWRRAGARRSTRGSSRATVDFDELAEASDQLPSVSALRDLSSCFISTRSGLARRGCRIGGWVRYPNSRRRLRCT
jgi:hypothetical protein